MQQIIIAAKEAYEQQKQQQAVIEEEKQIEREKELVAEAAATRTMFTDQFGIDPEGLIKHGRAIYLENNINLWRQKHSEFHAAPVNWTANKECANREEDDYEHSQVYQKSFYDLAGLGDFLNFVSERNLCWGCQNQKDSESRPQVVAEASTEEKLLSLLKQLIVENSYQGEI